MSEVRRMHIRCRAGAGREREALALRMRLARTARVHLPGALRSTLERRGPHVYVDRLDVTLDFEPGDYDDVTVAALWARCVGDALGALGADRAGGAGGGGVRVFADGRAYAAAALDEHADAGRLSWVFAGLPCGDGAVGALPLLEALVVEIGAAATRALLLEAPVRSRRFYERLRPADRAAALAVLGAAGTESPARALRRSARGAGARRGGRAGEAAAIPAPVPHPAQPQHPPDRTAPGTPLAGFAAWQDAIRRAGAGAAAPPPGDARAAGPGARATPSPHAAAGTPDAAPAPERGLGRARRAAGGDGVTAPEPAAAADADAIEERSAWWTLGGGLVLLWPWLGEYLAGDLPPVRGHHADPALAARIWALASLLGDDPARFVADPLVRLLAGEDPERAAAEIDGEAVPGAARVLRSFAAALPGFAKSPPGYLRAHLLLRGALVEPLEDDLVRVRLEPMPLDVLLARLPYPLGPFRLAGTPLITVERRAP